MRGIDTKDELEKRQQTQMASGTGNEQSGRDADSELSKSEDLPFHLAHPQYNLKPRSEYPELFFWFNKPDYIEDYYKSESDYYFIVKDKKFGILYWKREKHWYGEDVDYHRVIQCEYDRIDKNEEYFVCYKGSNRVFIDLEGNVLK